MTVTEQNNFYHVGYGKAGSTTLQALFFPCHKDIHFYGIRYDENQRPDWPYKSAQNLLLSITHPEYFAGFDQNDLMELEQQKRLASEKNQAFVYSNDHFSLLVAPEWSIGKMKELMPDAKILIIIRRQQDILKSIYKYKAKTLIYVPDKFKLKFVSFDEYFDYAYSIYKNRGGHKARDWVADYLRIIDFNRLVNFYSNSFGQDNVQVFLFEDLANDPKKFYNDMTTAIGLKLDENAPYIVNPKALNVSPNASQIRYMQLKAKLFSNFIFSEKFPILRPASRFVHKKLSKFRGRDIEINQEQLEILSSLYAEGNRELDRKFNLCLGDKGYLL